MFRRIRKPENALTGGRLLRRFAATAFIVFVLLGLGIGYLLGKSIESSTLAQATTSARDTLQTRLLSHLRPSDLGRPMKAPRYDFFRNFVNESVLSDVTVRVKIWNPHDEVVFSSDERIIGQSFEHESSLQSALGGSLVSNVPDLSNPENADDRGFGPLLQVYIPIRFRPSGPTLGAFEIYQRYGAVQSEIQQLQMRAYLFLGGGLLALFLLLFGVVRTGSRRIDGQQLELKKYTVDLEQSYEQTIQSLATAVDARDSSTEKHSERVTALAVALAKWMGFGECQLEEVRRGALLHDIGKIGVSDTILLKQGALTEREWREMRRHPQIGYRMLKDISFLEPALPIVCFHHERWDGSGYPVGLRGDRIPLGARLFSVIDAYDAITSDRPYRTGKCHEEAMSLIRQDAGSQFDPDVVRQFEAMMEAHPELRAAQRAEPAAQNTAA